MTVEYFESGGSVREFVSFNINNSYLKVFNVCVLSVAACVKEACNYGNNDMWWDYTILD